jgi:WD40 repeat protein
MLKGHFHGVSSAAFSPDSGAHIASGSRDNTIRLWDTASGAHLQTLEGHSHPVSSLEGYSHLYPAIQSVAFSPDGEKITFAQDNTVQLWDPGSGALLDTSAKIADPPLFVSNVCRYFSDILVGLAHSSTQSYLMANGWIYSRKHKRHICWIPVEFREASFATCGHRVALGMRDGRVIILDFSGIDSYYREILQTV